MKKITYIAVVCAMFAFFGGVQAHAANEAPQQGKKMAFMMHSPEVKTAITNNDYNAFIKAIEASPKFAEHPEKKPTQEQFAKMVEKHKQMIAEGKKPGMVSQAMQRLFGKPAVKQVKNNIKKGSGSHPQHTATMVAALDVNNYDSFILATKGTPMEGKVTKEKFDQMVKNHVHRKAVDQAIKNKDYNAFVVAHKGTPMDGKITKEQFNKLVEKFIQKSAQ